MFTKTAINFNQYFWTPYPFLILTVIGLFESYLAYYFFSKKSPGKVVTQIMLACLVANVTSLFLEYYLSVFLNGGNRILVWVPWVKILDHSQSAIYLISFPVIFLFTVLSEFIVAFLFLKSKFKWNEILKTTFKVNLISTMLLIIIINCFLFSVIKGQAEGIIDDAIPEIPVQQSLH